MDGTARCSMDGDSAGWASRPGIRYL